MAKKKKTKTASQEKKSTPAKTEMWVDKLAFVPINDSTSGTKQTHDSITTTTPIQIMSWNILAESYLTRRSHRELPRLYQNCMFSPC
jgi:mRNA deadenylase 3'-5' endonuclease subunit Ccr4